LVSRPSESSGKQPSSDAKALGGVGHADGQLQPARRYWLEAKVADYCFARRFALGDSDEALTVAMVWRAETNGAGLRDAPPAQEARMSARG
jgi:hypothetical protein